jgi:hypothetical protein
VTLARRLVWWRVEKEVKFIPHQVAEIEHLKARLKQYNDYDEIKRELEILKVYQLFFSAYALLTAVISMSSFPASMRKQKGVAPKPTAMLLRRIVPLPPSQVVCNPGH